MVVGQAQKVFEHHSKACKHFLSFLISLPALSQALLQIVAFGEIDDCFHSSVTQPLPFIVVHCDYVSSIAIQIQHVLPMDGQSGEEGSDCGQFLGLCLGHKLSVSEN